MFEGKIKVSNIEIPRVLLGTSPFVAAAHFGHRARLYQLDLYNNPDNIFKIIKTSHDMGITGIQVIPHPPIIEALGWANDIGINMDVVGTIRPENEMEDIEVFSDIEASSMVLHGLITDTKDWDFVSKNLQLIKDAGAVSGLATHMPFITSQNLKESPLLDLFDLYMVPVNKLGYLMDCDTYGPMERSELNDTIKSLNKTVITKKVLAAGILNPKEAFEYLKTVEFADVVALGIASENEAHKTFHILSSL
jgi:hypothetical protein